LEACFLPIGYTGTTVGVIYQKATHLTCAGDLYAKSEGDCIGGIWTPTGSTDGKINCATEKPNGSGYADPALGEFCLQNGGTGELGLCGDKPFEWDSQYCVTVSGTGIGTLRDRCGTAGDGSDPELNPANHATDPATMGVWNTNQQFCFNKTGSNPASGRGGIGANYEIRERCNNQPYGNDFWCTNAAGVKGEWTLAGFTTAWLALNAGEKVLLGGTDVVWSTGDTYGDLATALDPSLTALWTFTPGATDLVAEAKTASTLSATLPTSLTAEDGDGDVSGVTATLTKPGAAPNSIQPISACSPNGGTWNPTTLFCSGIGVTQ
jgi:hypothetical protein